LGRPPTTCRSAHGYGTAGRSRKPGDADLWRVDVESHRAPKEDIAESVETSSAEAAFDLKRRAVLAELAFDEETPTVTERPLNRLPFAPLFPRLLDLSDPVVMDVVTIVTSETL